MPHNCNMFTNMIRSLYGTLLSNFCTSTLSRLSTQPISPIRRQRYAVDQSSLVLEMVVDHGNENKHIISKSMKRCKLYRA